MTAHPLDRPVWNALATRWSGFALGDARAKRLLPDHGPFAASADTSSGSLSALSALLPPGEESWITEKDAWPLPPGVRLLRQATVFQMLADAIEPIEETPDILTLGDADAADMLALATLTKPGPFLPRTHRLGRFIGIREQGRLVAMAGERMRLDGFTEVSGVCTHPEQRGRGHAGRLMRIVARRMLDRGERPFLHVYTDNASAVALYQTLGFRIRETVALSVITPA